MKKLMLGLALFLGAVVGASLGFGGGVPLVPSSPTFNEPSQIVSTLNAFINQLNGNPLGSGGYAAQPGNVISLGSFCTGTSASGAITCNGQRGTLSFTGTAITPTTAGTTQTITLTDASLTTASICQFWWSTAFTAGAILNPTTFTPSAGSATLVLASAGGVTNAVTTGTLQFQCIN